MSVDWWRAENARGNRSQHKTLDLSAHLEFLVATGILESKIAGAC
jgi:hypothetical protein